YKRVQLIYGISLEEGSKGLQVYEAADKFFVSLDESALREFQRKYGITHILTYGDQRLDFPVIASNERYVLYQIR
ncbi:MAG: hypothetical protein M3Q97_08490, partial [Bacteroidota bacterium]|nr:hypothetical protein [Bacteroidota bacterium]